MTDPISYSSSSPRYGLPLLFSGQAQKEFYVNEAHSITDVLLHPAIEGETNDPPATPGDGECWLVGSSPSAGWTDHAGDLACYQSGVWIFVTPQEGMRLWDGTAGQEIRLRGGAWQRAVSPAVPAGGSMIDNEARAAIAELIAALIDGGILPEV